MLTICFEGIDGCGKSTQAKMLEKALQKMGYYPSLIKHPGQTKFGQEIRNLILNGTQPKADIAHRLLFWADYAETMEQYKDEDLLILDRHPYSSDYAYGYGLSENDRDAIAMLQIFEALKTVIPCSAPDLLFIIDVPPGIAMERIKERGKQITVIEQRGINYFEKVQKAYLMLINHYEKTAVVLNGLKDPNEIHNEVINCFRLYMQRLKEVCSANIMPL